MRTIYFVRHGKPRFPTEERYCIGGKTDWPIGSEGEEQCRRLAERLIPELMEAEAVGRTVEIWSSPMLRARQTAGYLLFPGQRLHVKEGLQEMDAGEWEGLPFSQLKDRYPELFMQRNNKSGMRLIPGAETDEQGLERFSKAVGEILTESDAEDLVIVAHGAVISLFLKDAYHAEEDALDFKPEYGEIVRFRI